MKNKPIPDYKIQALRELGLIIPPVELGGDVYIIRRKKPIKTRVVFIGVNELGEFFFNVIQGEIGQNFRMYQLSESDLGNFAFLTEKEAQNSLKEK